MFDPMTARPPDDPADNPCASCPSQGAADVAKLLHDLNNLLQAMQSEGELVLLRDRGPESVAHARRLVENAQVGAIMINEFRRRGALTAIDPRPVVSQTVDGLQALAAAHGAALDMVITLQDAKPVMIYPGELHSVVLNLVVNAMQACQRPFGRVEVHLQPAPPDRRQSGVRIMVKDNGIGMDHETVRRIFDGGYTTKPNGSGLGLYGVDLLVHRRGGNVSVDSQLGKGTVIMIDLPCEAAIVARSA